MEDTCVESSEFVFVWKIRNFRRLTSYTSPEFFADTLDRTRWELNIKPDFSLEYISSINISRKDEGAEIELHSSISCFVASGETICQGDNETYKIKPFSEYTFAQKIQISEISSIDREDGLVIHCKLRQNNTKLSEWGYCYAGTSCSYVVKKWKVSTSIDFHIRECQTLSLKSGSDTEPILTLTAFSAKNSSYFHFFITSNQGQYSRIKICDLETNKNEDFTELFSEGKRYDFPNFIEKQPNRELTLLCEYTCFDSEISTIEIMCGMFSKHKAFFKCPFNPKNTEKESENPTQDLDRGTSSNESNTPSCLSDDLLNYFTQGKFSDLALSVEDRSFPVHKSILCARAYEFRNLLKGEDDGKVLFLTDINASTLELFLAFLYSDRLEEIDSDEQVKLYYAAFKYGFEALKKKCRALLEDFQLKMSNVCLVLEFSEGLTDDPLRKKALEFFSENAKGVMEMDNWVGFMERVPLQASHLLHQFILSSKA